MATSTLNVNSSLKPPVKSEIPRRSADFHPSVWGDLFLTITSNGADNWSSSRKRIEQLKIEVRNLLQNASDTVHAMNLIDLMQRTGIAYHFDEQIGVALDWIHESAIEGCDGNFGLHEIALRFRLLRQQGYNVSSEPFKNFMDESGNFEKVTLSDVRGILSLYEAAHLAVVGEDILDEALVFTKKQLTTMLPHLDGSLRRQVECAFELPLHRISERLKARNYISCYEEDKSQNQALLELAKLDFNFVQAMHQKELAELSRWWKGLALAVELPFIRDRLVECYFWIVEVYFEPLYSRARKMMTKITILISVMDDIYDVYGTLDELQLFTDAIQRWDITATGQLPEYMKSPYIALLNTINGVEEQLTSEEKAYRIQYLKQAIKDLISSYFAEAKWYNTGYVPTFTEYMNVALISSVYPLLAVTSYVVISGQAEEADFKLAMQLPKMLKASSTIARLVNDIVGHKKEQERGHVASSVEIYMKEHACSKEEACAALEKIVETSWKELNEECLKPTPIALPLLMRVVNLTRVITVIYQYGEGYSDSSRETKTRILSVLVTPIPV